MLGLIYIPVNAGDDCVHGEWRTTVAVLTPDSVSRTLTFMGPLEGIVDACDDQQEP
jgi:hypothetical protein